MRLFFLERIRDEQRFESLAALRQQIERDLQKGKQLFESMKFMQSLNMIEKLSVKNPDILLQRFQPFEKIEKLKDL
jgi:hypothetical protein